MNIRLKPTTIEKLTKLKGDMSIAAFVAKQMEILTKTTYDDEVINAKERKGMQTL